MGWQHVFAILSGVLIFTVIECLYLLRAKSRKIENLKVENCVARHNLKVTERQLLEMHDQSIQLVETLLKSKLANEVMRELKKNGKHDDGRSTMEDQKNEPEVQRGADSEA